MAVVKVLIAVKTYPQPSTKYEELVCTAGFREDGSWIRLYPVPFRKFSYDKQYRKWQWIEIDCKRRSQDPRNETYHPLDSTKAPKVLDTLKTNDFWRERKKYALKNVYDDLEKLINDSKNPDWNKAVSLATFKPSEIIDFTWKETDRNWSESQLSYLKQQNLFASTKKANFIPIPKLPYEFHYKFKDAKGKISNPMIEDWEVGALYWKCLKRHGGNEIKALKDVKDKFLSELPKKDFYFFLGTTFQSHVRKFTNPFVIIGIFYPEIKKQQELL